LFFTIVPDIGNALAGVLSATQALRNGAARDPIFRRDLLGGMENTLLFLRIVYENWVVSGSVLSGKITLVPREVEPSIWLDNFLGPWLQRALDRRLIWEVQVPADHPPTRFDQNLVELALENLLSIAIDMSPMQSHVLVSSGFSREGGSLWFEVSDQGPALTGSMLADAIRRRSPADGDSPRLDENNLRFDEGRYLGLSVASAVAELHGGRLEQFERPGFSCSLRLSLQADAG
jgi:signal transduction histidine kinase